ncbi:hypothetical protein JCGZ_01950 [Jatropha curcas]|uniref:Uncharacterized protein n=1 Tax=Jatropha curcas TaxID=180498 RepID=A0A067LE61_JATCU|nr:hypothetical protein JCGZ_01950 [Jatropha curcas]
MESIQGQFRSYNSFLQDMREELQEIRAAQRSNTTRAHPSNTPPMIFQIPEDDEVDNPGVSTVDGDLGPFKMKDRKRHRTPAFYEAQAEGGAPTGPTGVVLGDVPFPPGMEVTLDPSLGLGPTLAIPVDLRQAPPQLQLDPENATHRYQELYQRFCFARTYIARLYSERHEMARRAAAVSRLQMENDRLCTRLEVEGIPLDFSDEEEDDDDSSSDDAPTPPPSSVRQAAAGPSQRRR